MRVTRSRIYLALAILLYAGAVGGAVVRITRLGYAGDVRVGAAWALTDFYTAAYYPVQAVLEGENPHNRDRFLARYPITDPYPPYAPTNLVLHLPFSLLAPGTAGSVYFVLNALVTLMMAALAFRLADIPPTPARIVLVAALVLLSRPGHWTLLLGQGALFLTAATYYALLPGGSPLRSSLGLSVTLIKPTWGIPLAMLMLAWGRGRAVALAASIAVALNAPLVALLAAPEGGVRPFVETLVAGHRAWQALPDVNPATSPTRVDATSSISRLLGTPLSEPAQALLALLLLGSAIWAVWRLGKRSDAAARDCAVGLVCFTTTLIGYHRGYDLVLLTAPFLTLAARGLPGWSTPGLRWIAMGCFVVPAINWVATESVLNAWQPTGGLWLIVTSASGLCLLALFGIYLGSVLRHELRPAGADVAPPTLAEVGR